MEAKGATPVVEVLSPEGAQRELVDVVDYGLGHVRHLVAVVQPAVTEVPILAGCYHEGRVKAAHGAETVCWQRQIIGSEESRPVGIGVVVGVDDVDYCLASFWCEKAPDRLGFA